MHTRKLGLLGWIAVGMLGMLPGRTVHAEASHACKPAVWTNEYRLAYTPREDRCPDVDDTLTGLANTTQFVAVCGERRLCGVPYSTVRVNGRLFLVPHGSVKALPYAYPSQLPKSAEDTPQPSCTLGRSGPAGADFYALDELAGASSRVHTVLRMRPETPLVVCRRQGDMVLAWLHGRPGLVPHTDVELSDRRHPQAFWMPERVAGKPATLPQGPFCLRPTWRGAAIRPTVLYLPTREVGGTDEYSMVQEGEQVEILSVHRGGSDDDVWYFAGHAAVRGFVRARDIRHLNDVSLADPAGPITGCPVAAPLVHVARDVQVTPVRWFEPGKADRPPEKLWLGKGLEVPVLKRLKNGVAEVLIDGVVARVGDPAALAAPHKQLPMTFEPADLVRKVDPGGCDQLAAFRDLPEGLPDLRPPVIDAKVRDESTAGDAPALPQAATLTQARQEPQVTPSHVQTAGDLLVLYTQGVQRTALREAVIGKAKVRTALDDQMHQAVAQRQDKPAPAKPPQGTLTRLGPIEYDAGHALAHGDAHTALVELAECLDGECATPSARFLSAEALLRLGYHAVAAELLLDVLESRQGPLEQALVGYREASKRFAPSPRAMHTLLPYCDGTVATDAEACFLGLQAAVDAEDVAGGLPFASQMRHLQLDGRRRALLALFDGAYRGAREDSAVDFAMAVQDGCKACSKRTELAQTLILQAARAAWEVGDVDAAWRAIRNLLPEVIQQNGDLVATVLFAVNRPGPARRLLLALEEQVGNKRPEVTLWKAHLQLGECRFTQAKATESLLDRRSRALRKTAPVVKAAMAKARGTLDALVRLDEALRRVGLPSRYIPELDRVLRPTGVCGQWREVVRERDVLAEKLDLAGTVLPKSVADQLASRIAEAEGRCFDGLNLASDELAGRVTALASRRAELQIDSMEALVAQLDRAQQLVGKMHDESTGRMVADWQKEGPSGVWAATLKGLDHETFPIVQTLAQVQATPADQQEAAARVLFERLLSNCGVVPGLVEPKGDNPAAEALDAEVARSLRCLATLSHGGISPDVQPLLYRYLPGVRFVRAWHLQHLDRTAFHPELWRQLTAWAKQNQPGDDLCLPEHAELFSGETTPAAVAGRP